MIYFNKRHGVFLSQAGEIINAGRGNTGVIRASGGKDRKKEEDKKKDRTRKGRFHTFLRVNNYTIELKQ
jgi:hypothetical protein